MDCYCYQEAKTQYAAVKDIVFDGGEKPCEDWLWENSVNRAVLFGLSLSISALNACLRVCGRQQGLLSRHGCARIRKVFAFWEIRKHRLSAD